MESQANTKTAGEVLGSFDPEDPFSKMSVITGNSEVASIPAPVKEAKAGIIGSDKIGEFLKNPEQSAAAPQEAAAGQDGENGITGAETAEEALTLEDDTLIIDDRDGKAKPWKEIKGLASLKRETDAERHRLNKEREDLLQVRGYVDTNYPFIEAASKSTFAKTLLSALQGGVAEDNAIAAAFAAVGKSPVAQTAAVNSDPEPYVPEDFDANDPQHLTAASKHLQWENRVAAREIAEKMLEEKLAPLQAKLRERDAADAAAASRVAQAREEAKKVQSHNQEMMRTVRNYLSFDPATLTQEQQNEFIKKLDDTADALGLTSEYARENYLNERDIRLLAREAFPHSNPFSPAPAPAAVKSAPTKKPLQPSPNSGGVLQSGIPAGYMDESHRIQSILEGMATGKPVGGVPQL